MSNELNIIDKIGLVYKCLHAGESLADSASWAQKANAGAIILVVLQSAVTLAKTFGYDLHLEAVDLQGLASGIGAVGVGIVAVIHTASNTAAGKK